MDSNYLEKQVKSLELDKILEILAGYTSTPDSKERCMYLRPNFEFNKVEKELAKTDAAYILLSKFGAPSFGGCVNCNNALVRAKMGSVLTIEELLNIARLLHVIRTVNEWKEHFCSDSENPLNIYFCDIFPNKYFEEKLFSAISSEESLNDNASITLLNIRRKIKASSSSIREKLEKIVKSQNTSKYLQENIITQRDGRYVVPVKSEYRAEIPGLIHDASASGSTLFIEPMPIVEINNELRLLYKKEKEEIDRILAELSSEAGQFCDTILISFSALIELDIIFSKAKYAFDIKGIIPKINTSKRTIIKNARHPLLKSKAVPITIPLGVDYNTLIITGPNTGGKTVSMKTFGLMVFMTMCGLMIPCDDGTEINIYNSIYSDIGDEQSIEQSLSTFSSHIKNIVYILENFSSDSLILLDELGAGTDPIEGAALARSIIEYLRQKSTSSIITTHYAELKSYALETNRVENASCEFNVATLKPTYKLLIGTPGRSNAFAISQKLGLNDAIINNAKTFVSDENTRFENVVSTLETARQTAEKEKDKAEKLRQKLESLRKENEKIKEETKKERNEILQKAREKANLILEKTQVQSERLLGELEDIKKSFNQDNASKMIKRAKESTKTSINKISASADFVDNHKEKYKLPRELMLGDEVLLMDIDKKATVVSLPDKTGKLEVLAGIIKMQTNIKNLKLIESKVTINTQNKAQIKRNVKSRAERTVETELDLRGMASDEALLELERFIDNAVLSGINIIRIIHGKGTGVLRKAVQTALKTNKSIRSYRLGVFGEGEDGVTIAELK